MLYGESLYQGSTSSKESGSENKSVKFSEDERKGLRKHHTTCLIDDRTAAGKYNIRIIPADHPRLGQLSNTAFWAPMVEKGGSLRRITDKSMIPSPDRIVHMIGIGEGIIKKLQDPSKALEYAIMHYNHENAHAKWTDRDYQGVVAYASEHKVSGGDVNLFEDARIEHLERSESKNKFNWENIEVKPKTFTCPSNVMWGFIFYEGNKEKVQANVPKDIPDGVLDRIEDYYKRTCEIKSTRDLIPLIVEFKKEFSQENQENKSGEGKGKGQGQGQGEGEGEGQGQGQQNQSKNGDSGNSSGSGDSSGNSADNKESKWGADNGEQRPSDMDASAQASQILAASEPKNKDDGASSSEYKPKRKRGRPSKADKERESKEKEEHDARQKENKEKGIDEGEGDSKDKDSDKNKDGEGISGGNDGKNKPNESDGLTNGKEKLGDGSVGDLNSFKGYDMDKVPEKPVINEMDVMNFLDEKDILSSFIDLPEPGVKIDKNTSLKPIDENESIATNSIILSEKIDMAYKDRLYDSHIANKIANQIEKLFTSTNINENTTRPTNKYDLNAFIHDRDDFFLQEDVGSDRGKRNVVLMADCSGSMGAIGPNGRQAIHSIRNIIGAYSELARRGKIEGNVILTAVIDNTPCCETYKLPMKEEQIIRIHAFAGGEGIQPSIKKNKKLIQDADMTLFLTDGNITDSPIDKSWLHKNRIFTFGAYVGNEKAAPLDEHFDYTITAESEEKLAARMSSWASKIKRKKSQLE